MNMYLYNLLTYFDFAMHPAAGKNNMEKTKRRSSKILQQFNASPDSLNIRAGVRKQDNVRRNPAP